ncbi:S-layer homology domain-containing protein, partial [Bacillus solimangrovi]
MAYQPKSFRKFIATTVTTAVVASAVAPAVSAAQFSDVQDSAWYTDSIDYLVGKEVLSGYPDGTFKPNGSLTRAEAAKVMALTLGLDTEGEATVDFPDVNSGDWFAPYVTALVNEGVISGFPDGTFKPQETLTRAQMAKMMAVAYGIGEDSSVDLDFVDLGDSQWAKGYIGALVGAGIVEGLDATHYGPSQNVTRAQAAAFVYKTEVESDVLAPKLEVSELRFKDSKTVVVTLPEVSEEEVTADNFRIYVDGKMVDVEEVVAEGKEVVLTIADLDGEVGTIEVNGVELEFDFTSLAVADVQTPNLRQIAVAFNQDVTNNEDVEDIDNYTLENTDGKDLEHRKGKDAEVVKVTILDGNIAVLTLNDAMKNQKEGKLVIDKAVLGEEVVFDLEFSDTTVPEVEDVQVIGENAVKVIFSESMDHEFTDPTDPEFDEDVFEVTSKDGDKTYRIKKVKAVDAGKEAIIEVGGTFKDGDELTVEIDNGLEDYAGFSLVKQSHDVTVVEDDSPIEVVGFRNASEDEVTLILNKDIKDFDDSKKDSLFENFYHTNTKNKANEVELDGNELTIRFDEDEELPDGTAYIYIDGEALTDYWGNENEQTIRYAVEVSVDNQAPRVDGDIDATVDKLVVDFDEELDADSAEDKDNYTILDEDGEEVEDTEISSIKLSSDKTTVTIKLKGDDLSGAGKYTLVIDGVEDKQGNATEDIQKDFEVNVEDDIVLGDVIKNDTNLYVDADDDETDFTILIDFDRKMTVGDDKYAIDNLSNYSVKHGVKSYTLDELDEKDAFDVEIDTIGDEEVEITITAEHDELDEGKDIWKDGIDFTILRVKDANGDLSEDAYANKVLPKADVKGKLKVEDLELTETNKIVFEFNKRIDNWEDANFSLETAVTKKVLGDDLEDYSYDIDLGDDDKTVTITLDEDLDPDATIKDEKINLVISERSKDNTVTSYGETLFEDGTDEFSVEVADGVAATYDDEYFEEDSDEDGYEDGYKVEKDNDVYKITLGFSEDIEGDADKIATTLKVKSDGDTLDFVDDLTAEGNEEYKLEIKDDMLIIKIKDNDTSDVEIDFKENNNFVDASDNKVEEFDVDVDLDEAKTADIIDFEEVEVVDAEKVAEVDALIEALDAEEATTEEFEEAVKAARDAYDALTDAE